MPTPTQITTARTISHDVSQLDDRLRLPLQRMMRDLPYGSVWLNSGYRPPWYQAILYAEALAKYHGDVHETRRWVAPPGGSNHGRHLAGDLGWSMDSGRQWFHANCGRYGLCFRLSNENWHIEPVDTTGPLAPDPHPRPTPPPAPEDPMAGITLDDIRNVVRQEVAAQVHTVIGADDKDGGDADPTHISQRDIYRQGSTQNVKLVTADGKAIYRVSPAGAAHVASQTELRAWRNIGILDTTSQPIKLAQDELDALVAAGKPQ